MKPKNTSSKASIASIFCLVTTFANADEFDSLFDRQSQANVTGGRILRTEVRPVRTNKPPVGVHIQNGRVLLTHNGGRWVQNNVHIANIAHLGEKRLPGQALTTVVPHRSPLQPPTDLMVVSGDDWASREQSTAPTPAPEPKLKSFSSTDTKKPRPKRGFFACLHAMIRHFFAS